MRGRITGPEEVEAAGFGGSKRAWLVRIAPLGDGDLLVRLIDRSEARAAEQMRVDFVANASHELRTPLSTLIGYAETLRERIGDIDDETRIRFMSIVYEEAQRMQRVVEDLISLSRIEAEKFTTPTEAVDLEQLIHVAVESAGRIAAERLGKRHHAEPVIPAQNPRGETVYWIGRAGASRDNGPGTDFHAVANHYVSVTPLQIDHADIEWKFQVPQTRAALEAIGAVVLITIGVVVIAVVASVANVAAAFVIGAPVALGLLALLVYLGTMLSFAPPLIVTAATAAIEVKVRMVCHSSQRDWIDRQSAGRVAAVQSSIRLSIGTSTARVTTSATTMRRNPASSHQNAGVGPPARHSSTRVASALSRARGRRMAIGTPRFWIISWPTATKVSPDSRCMVRLRENQVPQNTPITRANRTMVVARAARILTVASSRDRWSGAARRLGGRA